MIYFVSFLWLAASSPYPVVKEVSANSLFAAPENYYLSEVEFVGFFTASSPGNRYLWQGREDFLSGDRLRCIQVDGVLPEFDGIKNAKWNLTYLRFSGFFRRNLDSSAYCTAGVLSEVKSLEIVQRNSEASWEQIELKREDVFQGPTKYPE